jgi:WhiB family redox-sensing transcriptional regulator
VTRIGEIPQFVLDNAEKRLAAGIRARTRMCVYDELQPGRDALARDRLPRLRRPTAPDPRPPSPTHSCTESYLRRTRGAHRHPRPHQLRQHRRSQGPAHRSEAPRPAPRRHPRRHAMSDVSHTRAARAAREQQAWQLLEEGLSRQDIATQLSVSVESVYRYLLDSRPTTPDTSHDEPAARPLDTDLAWQGQALCTQVDNDIFFPDKGGSTREAKSICGGCPVISDCLAYALRHDERWGIWGGKSERDRRRLRRAS